MITPMHDLMKKPHGVQAKKNNPLVSLAKRLVRVLRMRWNP